VNALMTIMVRVNSAAALGQLRALEAQSKATAVGVGGIGRQASWGLPYISKWGNQVQWAGRQLMYNFTLPIALATAAASRRSTATLARLSVSLPSKRFRLSLMRSKLCRISSVSIRQQLSTSLVTGLLQVRPVSL
jgi:hypothetical protein